MFLNSMCREVMMDEGLEGRKVLRNNMGRRKQGNLLRRISIVILPIKD